MFTVVLTLLSQRILYIYYYLNMVDGSGGNSSTMDFNPTGSSTSAGGANTTIIENVAELQFGPEFEDIDSTFRFCYC